MLLHIVNELVGSGNVIDNTSTFDESGLSHVDQVTDPIAKLVCQEFGKDFERKVN